MRLNLDPQASELHSLRWETLWSERDGLPLALHQQVRLARAIESEHLLPALIGRERWSEAFAVAGKLSGAERARAFTGLAAACLAAGEDTGPALAEAERAVVKIFKIDDQVTACVALADVLRQPPRTPMAGLSVI